MKLYTRTGDDGGTGLFGGGRVEKNHPRVEAYGSVDELNAVLGVAAAMCGEDDPFHPILHHIQSRLFDLGADLATPPDSAHADKIARLDASETAWLEQQIDAIDGENEPLANFVLPGGEAAAAYLHVARTVCRRAERDTVSLAHLETINLETIRYLNRLSDLLFAMARRANGRSGRSDVPWIPAKSADA